MDYRVFVTRRIAEEALELLDREVSLEVWPEEPPPPYSVLVEGTQGCDGVLSMVTDRIDAGLLDGSPSLRVVSNMATGHDNIDVAAATRRGVLVGTTPGVLAKTCADLAFALLLATARRVAEADRFVRGGEWRTWHPGAFLGQDVYGATLGIVGLGDIGLEVARRAGGFDMRVLYYSRHRRVEEEGSYRLEYAPDLRALLREADFVTLHVPLTPETRQLMGAQELALMKRNAVLINTSRGQVVDQKALCAALKDGLIAGAGLDVTEEEPIPPNDPLLGLPNVVVTPHIGSASVATRRRMALMAAENLLAGLKGERMPHCINPEAREGQAWGR
ncbi:MAG: D-glycerate dehydrogenase [Chloroflexi bacterium]|nr:D-glycerate dehydrogenase [Chloroflexota bacterium]